VELPHSNFLQDSIKGKTKMKNESDVASRCDVNMVSRIVEPSTLLLDEIRSSAYRAS